MCFCGRIWRKAEGILYGILNELCIWSGLFKSILHHGLSTLAIKGGGGRGGHDNF